MFLKSKKFIFLKNYVCPIYNSNNLIDEALLKLILNYKPFIIIINIAGGKQEILAEYINNKLRKKNIIICSGAALSFHAGYGAKINTVIDELKTQAKEIGEHAWREDEFGRASGYFGTQVSGQNHNTIEHVKERAQKIVDLIRFNYW